MGTTGTGTLLRWLLLLVLYALATVCAAAEVIVEGSAPIRDGDVGKAREIAVRRALARAAESHGAVVNSQTTVRAGSALETAQVRASACTGESQIIAESIKNDELIVTVRVTVQASGSCAVRCQRSYINKLVVTNFAFEFPDHLLPSERAILRYYSAGETARMIRKHQRLLVDFDSLSFPYESPARAPEPFMGKGETETPFAVLARKHRAQYVLSGVHRDFALSQKTWGRLNRRIEIEVFLHDGATGGLLDKRSFAREAVGDVVLTDASLIGSPGFYKSDVGKVLGAQIEDIARWAEDRVACLPFMARVIKSEGRTLHIDAGAESGLSVGDTLNLHIWRDNDVRGISDQGLGREKSFQTTAALKTIYPRFAIVELIETPKKQEPIHIGDLLYSQ